MFDADAKAGIEELARTLSLEPAVLLAVALVESSGKAFGWDGRPMIRWEGHYFYRFLKGTPVKLKRAVDEGFAALKSGSVKNPSTQQMRWKLLESARAIDIDAANKSISWGVGQVMGANWKDLGYSSVQDLVDRCMEGVVGQVEVMGRFMKANHLIDELQDHKWRDFTLRYNGPSGVDAGYHLKIASAYDEFK